jgi:hypothetical protein
MNIIKSFILLAVFLTSTFPSTSFARGGGGYYSSGNYSGSGYSQTGSFGKDTTVHGYTRNDGTYVAPYHRTAPDNTKLNNYSTKGNINPYTGQPGTVNP